MRCDFGGKYVAPVGKLIYRRAIAALGIRAQQTGKKYSSRSCSKVMGVFSFTEQEMRVIKGNVISKKRRGIVKQISLQT